MSRAYHHIPWAERDFTHWSEIDTYRQCPHKHYLTYKHDWTESEPGPALQRGNRWHQLMEDLYSTGDAKAPIKRLRKWTMAKTYDTAEIDLQTWMLNGYYEHYGPGDPQFLENTVAAELEFEVELPDVGMGPLKLRGAIDLVVELYGKLWVVDHKSGKAKPKRRTLELADQWSLYVWALKQMGYDIFGSMHSYAKTERLKRDMTLKERYGRTPINRSDRELEMVARECAIQAWQARTDNGAPRNPGDHCGYRCSFLDVCIADRRYGGSMVENILQVQHKPRGA